MNTRGYRPMDIAYVAGLLIVAVLSSGLVTLMHSGVTQ